MFTEFFKKHLILVLFGAFLLLANLVVFFFLTLPNINAEVAGRRWLEDEERRGQDLRREMVVPATRKRILDSRKRDLEEEFYSRLLGAQNTGQTDLVRERKRIEDSLGMKPARVSYPPPAEVEDQPLKLLSMIYSLQGNYASLRKYIHSIENSKDYFLIINSIRLDSKKEGGELSMDISISTYAHVVGEESTEKE